jgi:hypothetical protein
VTLLLGTVQEVNEWQDQGVTPSLARLLLWAPPKNQKCIAQPVINISSFKCYSKMSMIFMMYKLHSPKWRLVILDSKF